MSIELFNDTQPGFTTRPNPMVQYFDVAAATTLQRGSVIVNNGSGFVNATTTDQESKYVTIQTIDNSIGGLGDIRVGCVGAGEFITVEAGAAIPQGSYVKVETVGDATDNTLVTAWVNTDDTNLIVGRYFAKPSGNIERSTSTPFNETFDDVGDFNVDDAVSGDVIEIRVGAS